MGAPPTAPGVYLEELPSGVRTITGVATSVTAFVGRTLRGSVDAPIRCRSTAEFDRRCGGLWSESELGHAVHQYFLNGGQEALVSRVQAGAANAQATSGGLVLRASSPGSWGNALRVQISHGEADTPSATTGNAFHLTIDLVDVSSTDPDYEDTVVARETFPHVSTDPAAPRAVASVVRDRSSLARVVTTPPARPPATGAPVSFGAGGDGTLAQADDAAYEAAIDRLDLADVVGMVAIPPKDRDTPVPLSTWSHALAWCTANRAMLLVNPPPAWGDAEAAAALSGGFDALRAPNAAYFYPPVLASDPLQGGLARPFAPTGAVAGVIARTDAERGVWKAPAGIDAALRGVTGLEVPLTEGDSGALNARGVNGLKDLAVGGPVVWGSRTAVGADVLASEWKYLPVRRVALFLLESLRRGTQWAVFEPNDEPLWGQLRLAVGTFLHDLFRQGAFQGATPAEAYLVRCDASTTTPADVDNGVVNVLVGFAPLKPAEFVILQFQQLAGGSSA